MGISMGGLSKGLHLKKAAVLFGVGYVLFGSSDVFALSSKGASLQPHTAVYNLKLEDTKEGSNITDATATMAYEFTGSKCTGYTVNIRFKMTITDRLGNDRVTDVRTSSWEGGAAKKFRFSSNQYSGAQPIRMTQGEAVKDEKEQGVAVSVAKPLKKENSFKGPVLFPTEHTFALMKAAHSGKRVFQSDIYDGTEKGAVVYNTTAIIGKRGSFEPLKKLVQSSDDPKKNQALNKQLKGALAGQVYWPVALAFYDRKSAEKKEDQFPDYEMSFDLYSNGISDNLRIDYGDFSLRGGLEKIDLLLQDKCE